MEALTAVAVAALTIYDMVKAVDQRDGDRRDHRWPRSAAAGAANTSRAAGVDAGRIRGRKRRVNILVAIYSPFAMWNIPQGACRRAPARVSRPHVPARRQRRRGARAHRRRRRGVHGHASAHAAGRGPAPAVDPQPGGRRRRHAVSGDAREPGRHHQLARHVGVDDRGARARGHAGAVPAPAARVPAARRRASGRRTRSARKAIAPLDGARVLIVGLRGDWQRGGASLRTSRRACHRHQTASAGESPGRRRSRRSGPAAGARSGRRRRRDCRAAHARRRAALSARASSQRWPGRDARERQPRPARGRGRARRARWPRARSAARRSMCSATSRSRPTARSGRCRTCSSRRTRPASGPITGTPATSTLRGEPAAVRAGRAADERGGQADWILTVGSRQCSGVYESPRGYQRLAAALPCR